MAGKALMIRNLGKQLKARMVVWAARQDPPLGASEAAKALIERGLDNAEAGAAGGHARAANLSPEERTAQARHAATSRWGKR